MYRSPPEVSPRRHVSRAARLHHPAAPLPAPPASVEAALDAELLGLLARAGGDATLRELFERDHNWPDAAPLWATAASLRCVRAGLVACHGRAAVLVLTPAGYEQAVAAGVAA